MKINITMKSGADYLTETELTTNELIAIMRSPNVVWDIDIGDNNSMICRSGDIESIVYVKE